VAADETLLLWKGCDFRQHLPLKRAFFYIEMFSVAEVTGYIYRFHIYTGKKSNDQHFGNIACRMPELRCVSGKNCGVPYLTSTIS